LKIKLKILMALKLKTPPVSEPVTLGEAKSYLRIADTDDDTFVNALITAVRQRFESWAARSLITQTWTLWLDGFPRTGKRDAPGDGYFELPVGHFDETKRQLEIPRPPLQPVAILQTYDSANTVTVFSSSNYLVDSASNPGRIALNQGAVWPTGLRAVNAVEIEFTAGYGNAPDVPDSIKQGILLWIKLLFADKSKLFESDESTPGLAEINRAPIPPAVKALWEPYRIVKI
jgi:uncharacterized phiE125 gp8 family phage protein